MPLNIRFFVGRREIIRSLGTHDLKVARKAVIEMADELDKLFSKIYLLLLPMSVSAGIVIWRREVPVGIRR